MPRPLAMAQRWAPLAVMILPYVFGVTSSDDACLGYDGDNKYDRAAFVLADALVALNWNHVYLMGSPSLPLLIRSMKIFPCHDLTSRAIVRLDEEAAAFLEADQHNDTVVYFSDRNPSEACDDAFAELLALERAPYSLLLFSDSVDQSDVQSCFSASNESKAFFTLDSGGRLTAVQTFARQNIVAQNVWRNSTQNVTFEHYDLDGATITMNTLSWMPWLRIFDCEEPAGTNCNSEGLLREVLDILADMFNFTYTIDREPSNVWGTIPADGLSEFNPNATFPGVMGSAIHGHYDIPISMWDMSLGRSLWIDFTMSVVDRPAAVFVNARPPLDFTLFFRPFTNKSWMVISAMVLLLFASVAATSRLASRTGIDPDAMTSWRVLTLSGWVFFLLVEAFYGGALTMFFSSAPSLPFSNLKEGMALYPDWKLMILRGEEVLINIPAENGEDAFVQHRERIRNQEMGLVQEDVTAGINMLKEPGWFLYGSRFGIISGFSSGNFDVSIHEVSREYVLGGSILVRKHSPLTRMLNLGIQRLRQTGMLDVITAKWTDRLDGEPEPDAQVLKLRQTVVVFASFACAVGACAVVLALEFVSVKMGGFGVRVDFYGGM